MNAVSNTTWRAKADLALAECWYWIRKLQARVLAGDYRSAVDASSKARPLLWTSPSFFETAEYEFYSGLCRAALCDCTLPDERSIHFEALADHYRQLEIWARALSGQFREPHRALVGAEIARLEGRELDAEQLYEQAIRSAHANGFVHNAALASELAARFYAVRGFRKDRKRLSAGRSAGLFPLGSQWQGEATGPFASTPRGRNALSQPQHYCGPGRPPGVSKRQRRTPLAVPRAPFWRRSNSWISRR